MAKRYSQPENRAWGPRAPPWLANKPEIGTRFHIYGDGPLRQELEDLHNELGLEEQVYFEGHTTDIHRQIASLDVLMITSDHEGLPMTLLEAMTIGTPVQAHAIGGIKSVCQNGECCWLSEHNHVEELAPILTRKSAKSG